MSNEPTRKLDGVAPNPEILQQLLSDDGVFPNNPRLPLIVYRKALGFPGSDPTATAERIVHENRWSGSWRNGIYLFHHYHSTAHEVLIVCAGSAEVQLGGPNGLRQEVCAGDVLILPAGTGHKNLGSTADFLVVGAYPEGQEMDMCYGKPSERPEADQNLKRVPLPKADPIYGKGGPLIKLWR